MNESLFFLSGVILTSIFFGLMMGPVLKRISKIQSIPFDYEDKKEDVDISKWRDYAINEYLYQSNPYARKLLSVMTFPDGYKEIIQKEMQYGFKSLTSEERKFLGNKNNDIGYWLGLKSALNTEDAKILREESKKRLEKENEIQ